MGKALLLHQDRRALLLRSGERKLQNGFWRNIYCFSAQNVLKSLDN